MTESGPTMIRSSRDPHQLRDDLEAWLAERLDPDAKPVVGELESTDANGMSSDTVMFSATWAEDGECIDHALVARIAPAAEDIPVFASYDLQLQFDVIKLVDAVTDVVVPKPWWSEPDASVLGAQFFVMGRIDGRVPPDNLPYTFGDNWLFDATPEQQRVLQDSTVDAIAALHDIDDITALLPSLERAEAGATPLRKHVQHTRAWYQLAIDAGTRSPLIDRGFEWIEAHWPEVEGPAVLSWGDARIGNVIYDGFTPAALLDWEMAGIGPAELDVAWLICAHRVLNDLATGLGLPGLPEFMRPDDIVARYESRRPVSLNDLHFYTTYAALQWAIVFVRTGTRTAHFAGTELPADIDDLIFSRGTLESLLSEK